MVEICDVNSGRDYKHLKIGDIPVYGTGGYMLSVDKALSFFDDAIGLGRKGTIDKPYLLKSPFWTVDTLFYVIPRENVSLKYLLNAFRTIEWKKLDESTGVPSLSKNTINSVVCFIPTIYEQKLIGGFVENLDKQITLHQRAHLFKLFKENNNDNSNS